MINIPKLRRGEFALWGFNNISIDELVEQHISKFIISDEEREKYNPNESEITTIEEFYKNYEIGKKLKKEEKKLAKGKKLSEPQWNNLYHKFVYLLHLIAKNGFIKENSKIPELKINSQILRNTISDDNYNELIESLFRIRLLSTPSIYAPNRFSKTYYINPEFYNSNNLIIVASSNIKVKGYIEKSDILFDKYITNNFYKRYNKTLSQIKLIKSEEAFLYTKKLIDKTTKKHQKLIYETTYLKLNFYNSKNYMRMKLDRNKRIYHVLTNIKREFKQYLNISYSVDIRNSHPLIFNKIILDYYLKCNSKFNISIINNFINNVNYNINTSHYYYSDGLYYNESNKSLNLLLDKILQNNEELTNEMPIDVIKYMVMTSQGQLWDFLIEKCKENRLGTFRGIEMDRYKLKERMFAQVFYSNIRETSYKLECGVTVHKFLAILFESLFPNVFKIMNENKPDGEESELSNKMMTIESELFHKILTILYENKSLNAINLHDAIIVLNNSPKKYTTEFIENVIKQVYNDYGLFPSISIESFNPK